MDKNFDFNRIGKRMPYKTPPEGFFDEMEANIWRALPQTRKRKAFRLRLATVAVAAAAGIALLLVLTPPSSPKEQTDTFTKVEQAFAELTQEDQAYMLAVYQEDIFMNE